MTKYHFFNISPQSVYFGQALAIYQDSFPIAEQHLPEKLSKRLENPKSRLFTALHQEEVVFMAVLWEMQGTDYLFLDYLAVKSTFRNQKIGSDFLVFLKDDCLKKGKKILLEIEKPDNPPSQNQYWKRWYFYQKHGAKSLQGVISVIPPIRTPDYTPVCLLVLGENAQEMDEKQVRLLVLQLFEEIYDRKEDDFFTQKVLQTIPSVVLLSEKMP